MYCTQCQLSRFEMRQTERLDDHDEYRIVRIRSLRCQKDGRFIYHNSTEATTCRAFTPERAQDALRDTWEQVESALYRCGYDAAETAHQKQLYHQLKQPQQS